jgi:thiopeptide-type bacteriocin biosynthesis protein
MAVAEQLFGVDSRAVAGLLRLDRVLPAFDRQLLVVRTVDELLAAIGYTEAERTASYRASTIDRRDSAATYRTRQRELREALGDPDWLASASAERAAVLAAARAELAEVGSRLDALAARGELWQSRLSLARSFTHMHCNRLLGIDRARERETIGLLLRTRESLVRAPVR